MTSPKIKAARFYSHHDIRIETISTPTPKADEVLVEVAWGGICGTDLHEYAHGPIVVPQEQHPHHLTGDHLPVTLGHEFCGYARNPPAGAKDATGQIIKEGMPVMADPRLNCTSCRSCSSGDSNVCNRWGFLGLSGGGGGGFSDAVAVRQDMCYVLPSDTRLDHAVLIEPLAVARHALTVADVPSHDWKDRIVLVLGGGPVGFSVLCNLRVAGCTQVFVSEPTAQRQALCKDWSQAIFDPTKQNVPNECRAATHDNAGVDIVFDCAGIAPGMQAGFAALRSRGTYVNVAGWASDFVIPMGDFLIREITIKPSMAYSPEDFGGVVRDFVDGKFAGAESMITAKIGLDELVQSGFEQLVQHKEKHSKIIVSPKKELVQQANGQG